MARRKAPPPARILIKPKAGTPVDTLRTDAWYHGQPFSDTRSISQAMVRAVRAPNKSAVFGGVAPVAVKADRLRGFFDENNNKRFGCVIFR